MKDVQRWSENILQKSKEWADAYDAALEKKDKEQLQHIYREIYLEADQGKGWAVNLLGYVENYEKNNKVRVARIIRNAADATAVWIPTSAASVKKEKYRLFPPMICAGELQRNLDSASVNPIFFCFHSQMAANTMNTAQMKSNVMIFFGVSMKSVVTTKA